MKEPPKMNVIYSTPPKEVSQDIIIQAVLGMTWEEFLSDLIRNRAQYSEEADKKCQAGKPNVGCIKSGRT